MADNRPLRCELITPDRHVLDTDASSVVLPAHDGEIGFLRNRAPILCKMGIGICRITTDEGVKRYFVDSGFARVLHNRVTILTQNALAKNEIDAAAVERELADARSQSAPDADSQTRRRLDIERASAKMRLLRS